MKGNPTNEEMVGPADQIREGAVELCRLRGRPCVLLIVPEVDTSTVRSVREVVGTWRGPTPEEAAVLDEMTKHIEALGDGEGIIALTRQESGAGGATAKAEEANLARDAA